MRRIENMRLAHIERRQSRLLRRLTILAVILMAAPMVRGSLSSLDMLGALPSQARSTLDRLAGVFGLEVDDSLELNSELGSALGAFEDIGEINASADKAIADEDPFVVVETNEWGEIIDTGFHRYTSPDLSPELIEATRVFRASLVN